MKLDETTYKKYPFPVRIFISYVLLSIIGIVLLDVFAAFLIADGNFDDFFNGILTYGLYLLVYAVGVIIFGFVLGLLSGSKIYRGTGLYRFTMIVSILCPIAFVSVIAILKLTDTEYTFFNFLVFFLEFSIPLILNLFLHISTRRCKDCGLINTFKVETVKTDSLGKERKFHTEGGYYYNQKSTGRFVENNSVAPEAFNVEVTTRTYVPKTTVSDGVYEKKRTVTDYRCAVCGNVIKEVFDSETKIGD